LAELKSILAYYQPDIMIVGDDYKGKEIIGREYVKEVVFFAKTPNISTTKILNNKKN
jgi:bifunctional ADP-heptose synthase (sugar kinase/adenylyltransferase)